MGATSAPKTTGLKYTYRDGEGYGDWYRANTGQEWDGTYLNAKPEGMSDVDWTQGRMIQQFEGNKGAAAAQKAQTGQQLTDIYNQQTSAAQASYDSLAKQYQTQMKGELEYAGVLHERMKKYLPQQMAAQGMGGMGITQTAGANAVAKHMGNRNAIIGQNQAAMNELSRNHGERQAAIDTEYKSGMMAADATYNDRMTELSDQLYTDEMALFGQTVKEKEDEQTEYYAAGLSGIKEAKTREEALSLAEQMKPYISESQYNALVVEANNRGNVLDGVAGEETDAAYTETKKQFEALILGAVDAEARAAYLEQYKDKLTPEDYQYYQNSIANLDGLQTKEDTQAGYDAAHGDLTSLYQAGASSADLQSTFDALKAAGKIEPGRETYWAGMISLRQKDEADLAEGKTNAMQKESADWGMTMLGEALSSKDRQDILIELATWKGQGKITQTQYDMAVQYCRVLDGNAEYLEGLESEEKENTKRARLVDDIIGYIVDVAGDHAEALEFYNKHKGDLEFSEAEQRSIDIALEMRENMDEDEALLKMTEEQSAAYDQCVSMLGLCTTTAKQLETLEKFRDKLAPEVYEELKMVLEFQAEDPETQAVEKEAAREKDAQAKGYSSAAEYDQAVLEGKEYVESDGKQYQIIGEAISINDMGVADKKKYTDEIKKLGYTNPYGKDIPNGATIQVPWERRGPLGSMGAQYKSYTYYNGEWYQTVTVSNNRQGGRGGTF